MKRISLTNGREQKQNIDMDAVYREIDSGKTVKRVAAEFGVCERTLYRWHYIYQAQIEEAESQTASTPYDPFILIEEGGGPG